tara:strand:- start:228 stop:677 length:450 start_codon:yes stop_codon:yes gene_type:complete
MEPISLAVSALGAIKAGISAGKELHSLTKPLAKLFDGIDDAKRKHSSKRNSAFNMSSNEEALNTFIAKKQAEDLEAELRDIIVQTRGISAWHELVRLRVDIRKQRAEEEKEKERARRERAEIIFAGSIALLLLGGLVGLIVFLFIQFYR